MHPDGSDRKKEANNFNNDKVVLYFRGANKISYRYQLDDQTDLNLIKGDIARKRNVTE